MAFLKKLPNENEPDINMCAYCGEPVEVAYTYKWFPDRKQMLKVHFDHLKIRENNDGEGNKPDDAQ